MLALLGLLAIGPAKPAAAHQIDTSSLTISLRPDSLKLVLVLDESILLRGFDLDRNRDGVLWREEMLAGVPKVFDFVATELSLSADAAPLRLERASSDVRPDNNGSMYITVLTRTALARPVTDLVVTALVFDRLGPNHKVLLKLLRPDQPLVQAVLTAEAPSQQFQVSQPRTGILGAIEELFRGWFE